MIIAILNQKGGTGKTISSINLSRGLSIQNKKVLLIDSDPQAHTTFTFNIERQEKNISHILDETIPISEAIVEINPFLSILPSSIRLSSVSEKLYSIAFREEILKTHLNKIKDAYDFIIIDSPPTLGVLINNIIYTSDFIIIPCEISIYSLEGMGDLINTIRKIKRTPEYSRFKILITKHDPRSKISNNHILKQLETLGLDTFKTFIPRNEALNQAGMAGKSILEFAPSSKGASAYSNLTKEVLEICQTLQNSKQFQETSIPLTI